MEEGLNFPENSWHSCGGPPPPGELELNFCQADNVQLGSWRARGLSETPTDKWEKSLKSSLTTNTKPSMFLLSKAGVGWPVLCSHRLPLLAAPPSSVSRLSDGTHTLFWAAQTVSCLSGVWCDEWSATWLNTRKHIARFHYQWPRGKNMRERKFAVIKWGWDWEAGLNNERAWQRKWLQTSKIKCLYKIGCCLFNLNKIWIDKASAATWSESRIWSFNRS